MYISSIPIPFHDILEVYEYLTSLSPDHLMQYDGLPVGFPGIAPLCYIRIYYNSSYIVTFNFSRKSVEKKVKNSL